MLELLVFVFTVIARKFGNDNSSAGSAYCFLGKSILIEASYGGPAMYFLGRGIALHFGKKGPNGARNRLYIRQDQGRLHLWTKKAY